MLFNSIDYAIFLPIIFILYWFVLNKRLKHQNILILISSYLFYSLWDWRFLGLIILSSIIDYSAALKIFSSDSNRIKKLWLSISILINLGLLGVLKYFNFFSESFNELFSILGYSFDHITLNVILPVGISFYTFQTLSYTIDVYRGKMAPTKNAISFFTYVSFFPQLVAGPIERASHLLPQFQKKRKFNYNQAKDGLRQILWGLFKKVVVADNCALIVNEVFGNYHEFNSFTICIAAIFFAFQIYGDFSGYSDIAIGSSRLLGLNLTQNFAFPYFSRDIAEFWRRWHISLSTWFKDYLYIPLGGSRGRKSKVLRNVLIIFIVSGFWHGANWTFITWGALNGLYFLPLLLLKKNRNNTEIVSKGTLLISIKELFQIICTFILTTLAWIFFRSESLLMAKEILFKIFTEPPQISPEVNLLPFVFILILLFVEWLNKDKAHGLELSHKENSLISPRWIIYIILIYMIIVYGAAKQEFIYFQF